MTADERDAPMRDHAARGEAARLRTDELQLRRTELASGRAASAETAERARVRAEESLQRAIRAHRSAAEGHLHAGAAHLRAAAAHEQAAMLAGNGAASTFTPSDLSAAITRAQLDPSAQAPCASTTFTFPAAIFVLRLLILVTYQTAIDRLLPPS